MTTLGQTSSTETQRRRDEQDATTSRIIAVPIEVHRNLGPGLLESVYEECLCRELRLRNIRFERQVTIPIVYQGIELTSACYRLDIVVEDQIILEMKIRGASAAGAQSAVFKLSSADWKA